MGALVQELERISKTKKDYVVPSTKLWVGQHPSQDGTIVATVASDGYLPPSVYDIGPVAHEQFAQKTDIPIKYYRRMLADAPQLVGQNVNHWLSAQPKNYLVRTLDGHIRAVLSDKYWAIDNYDVLFHVAKTGRDLNAEVTHLALTDERLHIRLIQPDFKAKITGGVEAWNNRPGGGGSAYQIEDDDGGDYVFGGIVARNSEVGRGGFTVEFVIYRAKCRNLLVVGKSLRQVHLGGTLEAGDDGIVLTNETQEAKAKALWLEVRDMVTSAFTPEIFADIVAKLNKAQAQVLDNPVEAVDAVVKSYGLPEAEKQLILNELINPSRGPNVGPTVWGLINAVTVRAHDRDADAGHELSTLAADLLDRELVAVR